MVWSDVVVGQAQFCGIVTEVKGELQTGEQSHVLPIGVRVRARTQARTHARAHTHTHTHTHTAGGVHVDYLKYLPTSVSTAF